MEDMENYGYTLFRTIPFRENLNELLGHIVVMDRMAL